ncbi:MAG: hypothetical protein JJT96_00465 [Opitutales bacterium]|nr:hypothetical protein [Opitutales bacterium]
MPLAFCILAHKNPRQLRGLIEQLNTGRCGIFVHYDKHSPASEHAELQALARELPRLTLIRPRKVNWGRWSQMQAQLDMMETALATDLSWTHLLTISGQDFPLQTVDFMEQVLNERPANSMIEWFDPFAPGRWKNARERIMRWHFDSDVLHRILRIPGVGRRIGTALGWQNRIPFFPGIRRRIPEFFRWFGGSNHYNLSRDAVEYVLHHDNSKRIARRLRRTGSPDESFVQSVLLNSPLVPSLQNDDRRAIIWDAPDNPSPRLLSMTDWPLLEEARSAGKLFARKFDSAVDAQVLEKLSQRLSEKP